MARRRGSFRAAHRALWPVLAAVAVVLSACNVQVHLAVNESRRGAGTVTVTVTLDRQAATAVGNLAGQLKTADLAAAGWQVSPPVTTGSGSVVLRASHPFSDPSQVGGIVAEVAGSNRSSPPFRFVLQRRRGLWVTTSRFTGTADLTCGLDCFGDPGLARALGSPTGINPAQAAGPGTDPSSVFHFLVTVNLVDGVTASNAPSHTARSATWPAPLGAKLTMDASSRSLNATAVAIAAAAGFAVLVAVAVAVIYLVRRRRRRRPQESDPPSPSPETVTPAS